MCIGRKSNVMQPRSRCGSTVEFEVFQTANKRRDPSAAHKAKARLSCEGRAFVLLCFKVFDDQFRWIGPVVVVGATVLVKLL